MWDRVCMCLRKKCVAVRRTSHCIPLLRNCGLTALLPSSALGGRPCEEEDGNCGQRQHRGGQAIFMLGQEKAVEESKVSEASVVDLFRSRRCRRALAISLGVVCCEQLAGINVVLFYSQGIFISAGGAVSDKVAPIVITGIMLVEACLVPFLVDRVGRRFLLIFSSTGMSFALMALGVYFYLSETGKDIANIGWIPVTSLIIYIMVYTPGYGCLPYTVTGEVFPPNAKSVTMPMAAFVTWFTSFLVTRFFGDIVAVVGNYGPFFVFSGCALLASFFVYFVVPETNGKTLEEIQDMLGEE